MYYIGIQVYLRELHSYVFCQCPLTWNLDYVSTTRRWYLLLCLLFKSEADWDNLVNLTRSTNMRLLFDLNLQLRYGQNWDPSNAIRLLQYSVDKGYGDNIDFELGNGLLFIT